MESPARVVVGLVVMVSVVSVLTSGAARAADPKAAEKIAALNLAGVAAHKSGDHESAKSKLLEAVVLGKANGLGSDPVMAKTYLHLGVVHAEGLKDADKAARYLGLALKVQPDIGVDATLNTKAVTAAMDKARAANSAAPQTSEAAETAKNDLAEVERSIGKAPRAEKKVAPPPPEPAKPAAAEVAAKPAPAATAAAPPPPAPKPAEAPKAAEPAKPAAVAAGPDPEKEKLHKEKAELEKQLAAARDGEKKEREAREKLQKEKTELEKQLATVKESDKKERDAREKLEQEKQVAAAKQAAADAKEEERRKQEEKVKQEKARLVDGPDLPADLPQPLFCPGMDERVAGADLHVHCATQPRFQAKSFALYYRLPGAGDFTTVTMEANRKGWFHSVIPAAKVSGKTIQYYVEAKAGDGKPVASNGKPKSPNILLLLPAGTKVAPPATPVAATTEPAEDTAKSTTPAKRKKARARAARRRAGKSR